MPDPVLRPPSRPRLSPLTLAQPLLVLLVAAWLLATSPVGAVSPAAPSGTGGAVASDDRWATEAGLEVLASGGNAVDAAVATALTLAVTLPEAGNLLGGGFAVVRMVPLEEGGAAPAEITSLDFREVAPAAATADLYLDAAGEPLEGASLVGGRAAGVPGTPKGLFELHRRHGRLPWAWVVAPAARRAREGFPVSTNLHRRLEASRELLERFPESAERWLPGGKIPAVGETITFPALADTLTDYAARGPDAIVRGRRASEIAAVAVRHGGILTARDLSDYEPVWRPPIRFEAFGWKMASMDLPSSGGILLGQIFGLLERKAWAEAPRFGADRHHLLAEAFRATYADRYLLADPSSTEVTAGQLLDPAWLDRQAGAIPADRARASDQVEPYPATGAETAEPGELEPLPESLDTTHLSVLDDEGNAVALTTTLNGSFGAKLWVPGLGFFNNEMDDFTTVLGQKNLYGLRQGEANQVRAGHRPLSSMSPTVAWREGEGGETELVAIGGRGGSRIPTSTAQVLLHLLVDGDPLQAALDRPRLHHQWLPDRLEAEDDALAPETRQVLTDRGHQIEIVPGAARVNATRRLPDGTLEAAVDPRGPGTAAVVDRRP